MTAYSEPLVHNTPSAKPVSTDHVNPHLQSLSQSEACKLCSCSLLSARHGERQHTCAHTQIHTHTHTHTHTFILQTFIKRTACDHNCDSGLHQWVKYFQLCHNCDFTFKIRAVNSCSHTNTHLRHTHTHTHTHTYTLFLKCIERCLCLAGEKSPPLTGN